MSLVLSIGFSVTANAEDIKNYDIRQDIYLLEGSTIHEEYWLEFTPNNQQEETDQWVTDSYSINTAVTKNYTYRNAWNIFFNDQFPFELNKVNRVSLENFYWGYLINQASGVMVYGRGLSSQDTIYVVVDYVDGTNETLTPTASQDSDYSLDINFDFKPTKNVSRLTIIIDSPIKQYFTTNVNRFEMTCYLGEVKGDTKHNFNLEIQSEEAGLLSGLIGWVQNIYNKIGEIVSKIGDIATAIAEIPVKLWTRFSDGLQQLFVPDSNELFGKFALFDQLMENKLGALYQIGDTLIDGFGTISETAEQGTIDIPTVTLSLPNNSNFTFGGYSVQVVPDGFTFIVTTLKLAVGIIATLAFANGIRRRYDEFVRS